MKHLRRFAVAACVTIYHSHGYSFFIDTWVMIDLAAKSEFAHAASHVMSAFK